MLPALILALAALGSALLRLWAYRAQLLEMARVLEETPPESNLRLTVRTFGMAPRRLCRAVNQRLEEGRQLRLETQKREQELKYTMTCISHDIRTPLAGAMGYLQLLEEDPERQTEYLDIVRERLEKLAREINPHVTVGLSYDGAVDPLIMLFIPTEHVSYQDTLKLYYLMDQYGFQRAPGHVRWRVQELAEGAREGGLKF